MWRAALVLLGLWGCASTPTGPFFNDDRYLRFGVDPAEETDHVIESQKARGLVLGHRQLGRHFTALGFMDEGGRSSAVRILTVRGIAIALDSRPETALEPATSYALLAPPIADTHDADKDGFEEVFVEARSPGSSCLKLYRVRDVGYVDPVVVETQLFGQEVCPRAAVDLDGDAVVELVTEVELSGFPEPGTKIAAPRMVVPLWADQHRFVARASTRAQRAWLAAERARREVELEHARRRLDMAGAYVLAIELAALAYLEGSAPAEQLRVFDAASNGLVLTPEQARTNLTARERIFAEWNVESSPGEGAPERAADGERPSRSPAERAASDAASSRTASDEAGARVAAESGKPARSPETSAMQAPPEAAAPSEPAAIRPAPQPRSATSVIAGAAQRPRAPGAADADPAPTRGASDAPASTGSDERLLETLRAGGASPVVERPHHGFRMRKRAEAQSAAEPDPATASAATPELGQQEARRASRPEAAGTAEPPSRDEAAQSVAPQASRPPTDAARPAASRPSAEVPLQAAPFLAEGEILITPESAAAESPLSEIVGGSTHGSPSAAGRLSPERAHARELGNAIAAARQRAADARRSAGEERAKAQAARLRAAAATDLETALAEREVVAAHVARARNHAQAAADHAAEAARLRAALEHHKAAMTSASTPESDPPTP